MALQLLTNSRRNSFGTCHRRHQFEYELCMRPIDDAGVLRIGSLTHLCLEKWWWAADGTTTERLIEIEDVLHAQAEAGMDAYDIALVRAIMVGYEVRWGNLHAIKTLSVEAQYQAPLMNPATGAPSRTFALAGKLDVIAEIDGRVVIVEHKTTSEDIGADSRYWLKLAIDGQVSGYYIGAKALGYEADGCCYDVLRKPGMKPANIPLLDADGIKQVFGADGNRVRNKDGKSWRQKASTADGYILQTRVETPEEYFARVLEEVKANPEKYYGRREVARTDSDLVEYLDDMWATGREIAEAQTKGRWPRNPRSCDIYSGCPYFDVCASRASIEDTTRFIKGDIHRELAPTAEAQ